jgi:hypothetical protein
MEEYPAERFMSQHLFEDHASVEGYVFVVVPMSMIDSAHFPHFWKAENVVTLSQ